jgi:hypothetical protein
MQVNSWYGVPATIDVENPFWHSVRVGRLPLNHFPLVNLGLRQGLTQNERLHLSHLHEYGHFQTLPLAVVLLFLLGFYSKRPSKTLAEKLAWLAALFGAHQALWEVMSEVYVLLAEPGAYRRVYQKSSRSPVFLFWLGMSGLGVALSAWLLRENRRPVGSLNTP